MQTLTIDEHGEIFFQGSPTAVTSLEVAQSILKNVKLTPDFLLQTEFENETYIVESFDHPLVGLKLIEADGKFLVQTQYQLVFEADPKKFSLDPFDRVCGLTTSHAPFRLTEKAQADLFDRCDEFDDDSFTLDNITVSTPEYYFKQAALSDSDFWNQIYKSDNSPGWDLDAPALAFQDMLHRLKLPKSRILVLGCGSGHDAAFFAEAGHVVTAVDFSAQALHQAKQKYGHMENLHFMQEDVFNLPQEWNYSFDIVIEHTCFCAIEPQRRKELIKVWRRMLHEEGQIMAVFFAMLKRSGPPYGSSEWELRELLKKDFHFLFWGRWDKSLPRRQGRELFVLAKKRKT